MRNFLVVLSFAAAVGLVAYSQSADSLLRQTGRQ